MSSLLESLTVYIGMALASISQPTDIVFAGDAMQHSAQIDAAHRNDGTYDYSECFNAVKDYVSDANYAVVNLETPLGGKPYSGYPCFCAPDSYAAALKDAGFDMFLTANNHTLDRRDRGLCRTIATLDSLEVDHIGTYYNDSCRSHIIPLIKDINGYKVGFLNYTYGTNGIQPGKDVRVDYIDTVLIGNDIAATRSAGAEIIVVAPHWGDEYKLLPNTFQKKLADFLVDRGVDIVMGGHPHVIQPMELNIDSTDTLKRSLVVYSLGNFISNMKTRDTRGGAMVKVTLKRNIEGKAYVADATYRLVFTLPASGGNNYRLINACDTIKDTGRQWEYHRNQFVKSAKAIFDRYNVNVSLDMSR